MYGIHTKLQIIVNKHISQNFDISDISKSETFVNITRFLTNCWFCYSTTSFVNQLAKFPSEPLEIKSLHHTESLKTLTSLKYP